jgi:phosphatidylserine/phosphatidylglycerophosphate/cardiolipin synthase-like enzyme
MEALAQAFFQTFATKVLSKHDKQTLRKVLAEVKPDLHQQAWLRSRIFNWVYLALPDANSQLALTWLEEVNKILSDYSNPVIEEKVYFSPGEACLQAIISNLQQATRTVDICVFTISDNRIAAQIIACHKAGKRVRIITDNEKLYDTGSDIQQLAETGIPVRIDRTSNHMHHKFAIVDSQLVLTGSYNWTRSAAEYNHENILLTNHMQAVQSFEEAFEKMWLELKVY